MFSLYQTLGASPESRRRRLYGRMENRSAADAMKGLSTRIPFLKRHFCREGGPDGESVRSEPRWLDRGAPAGHVFRLRVDLLVFFRLRGFLEDIARFNGANAAVGSVQAIKTNASGEYSFLVAPCDTVHIGDLRISTITDSSYESRVYLDGKSGAFNHPCYGIVVRKSFSSEGSTIYHEAEHAQHYSLWHLAGFPVFALGAARAEYLAMLRELADFGTMPSFFQYVNRLFPGDMNFPSGQSNTSEHDAASFFFLQRLVGRYRMEKDDVLRAVLWAVRDYLQMGYGMGVRPRCAEQFARMRNAAIGEYNETYARMFGMPLDDLRDVVSRLSQ